MEDKNLFEGMKGALQEQIKKAYIEGANQGAINTCAIVYATLSTAGLETSNFLFDILRDIATSHGCADLDAEAAIIMANTKNNIFH